jgi:hypothetical protein
MQNEKCRGQARALISSRARTGDLAPLMQRLNASKKICHVFGKRTVER